MLNDFTLQWQRYSIDAVTGAEKLLAEVSEQRRTASFSVCIPRDAFFGI